MYNYGICHNYTKENMAYTYASFELKTYLLAAATCTKDLLDQLKDYKDDLKTKDDCEIVTVYRFIFTNCLLLILNNVCFQCQY